MPVLQFQPLNSQPTPSFWTALTSRKLDDFKLDDSTQSIAGWLEEGREIVDNHMRMTDQQTTNIGVDGSVTVGGNAFGQDSIKVQGVLKMFNTIEEFRQTGIKKELFGSLVDMILDSFTSNEPVLNPFLLVTYADLKKYTYHYWFAFPALVADPAWDLVDGCLSEIDKQDVQEIRQLEVSWANSKISLNEAFLVKGDLGVRSIASLAMYQSFFSGVPSEQRIIAFHDPSSSRLNPGWPLRNVLYYLNAIHGMTRIRIVCLREGISSRQGEVMVDDNKVMTTNMTPVAVGWERNKAGKLASRVADLGPTMDPIRLAEQAVDLNLKLMKWRIAPTLDLDKVSNTKCLLLGAGTLGCYVARNLMAWGVRNITFVDSARVSFSNPVRQPLFRFEDCLNGGRPKAACAADRLKEIFPNMLTEGYAFNIPMPGHPVPPSLTESTSAEIQKLEELIAQHDAVFLLMDSRESRWLPTMMGMNQGKIVINAALGFDTYLVMRHGIQPVNPDVDQLGCYYCNDVVAPTDSLTDRTLDQMCTVTRPGVAPIAAASATELLVSLLQHPLGAHAPPYVSADMPRLEEDLPLGNVPHQVRGILGQWRTNIVNGPAYDKCTACSAIVLDAYRQQGISWLFRVFADAKILEQVTGLDKLHAESESALNSIEWLSSDDESEGL
ncbi:E1-like protein-activating enzyme Gsa7p/Apg7p [Kwoniella shivajii]|uniref:Ubiquitin-like modifier-activating enzyme ATG7 n=1 Tax=Kwoniella shivajii TaxID=564305 RepID=A0ABZ1CU48_9TREE|nr:E1-like protein-activating enzyme Gsa7p/Apg7p [Kwoniella shivajii]